MKRTLALLLVASVAAAALLWSARPEGRSVVLIVIDTLRVDALGCYGGREAATPNLDALAARGLRHDLAMGSYHQTTASMGAMFLGATPSLEGPDGSVLPWNRWSRCGMSRFGTGSEGSECLPRSLPTLAERLGAAGYRTVGVCSNSLLFRPAGFDRGFDVWKEVGDTSPKPDGVKLARFARDQAATRAAPQVVEAALAEADRLGDEPFFLYVHFMDVHDWWTPGAPSRHFRHTGNYWPAVEEVDARIGELLAGLRERGLLEDAVVVVTADHGEALSEPHPIEALPTHQGNPTYETVARIPLIVAGPEASPDVVPDAGLRPGRPWRTEDLPALLARVAGLGAFDRPEPVLGERDCYYSEFSYRTLRSGDWKLTCRRSATGADGCALFDLAADPAEKENLASAEAKRFEEMSGRLEDIAFSLRATEDVAEPGAPSRAERDKLRALGYAH